MLDEPKRRPSISLGRRGRVVTLDRKADLVDPAASKRRVDRRSCPLPRGDKTNEHQPAPSERHGEIRSSLLLEILDLFPELVDDGSSVRLPAAGDPPPIDFEQRVFASRLNSCERKSSCAPDRPPLRTVSPPPRHAPSADRSPPARRRRSRAAPASRCNRSRSRPFRSDVSAMTCSASRALIASGLAARARLRPARSASRSRRAAPARMLPSAPPSCRRISNERGRAPAEARDDRRLRRPGGSSSLSSSSMTSTTPFKPRMPSRSAGAASTRPARFAAWSPSTAASTGSLIAHHRRDALAVDRQVGVNVAARQRLGGFRAHRHFDRIPAGRQCAAATRGPWR